MLRSYLTLAFAVAVPLLGGETAIFNNGMRLHVDRHEVSDGVIRLYRGSAVTELPAAVVASFDVDETPVPAAVPESSANPPAPPVAAAPAAPRAPDLHGMVRDAAARAGLPPAFVESVAKTESGFNPAAVSPKGAVGVMQLMPDTAKQLGADPQDPAQNIEAGARLLRELLLKYDGDVVKALSAYNAGEGAVDRYQGMPPYNETQQYVNTVVRDYLSHGASASPASTGGAAGKGAGN